MDLHISPSSENTIFYVYSSLVIESLFRSTKYAESSYHCSPNGHNIRSLTTLLATSPPFCNATAPTIAYSARDVTISWPDPLRFAI